MMARSARSSDGPAHERAALTVAVAAGAEDANQRPSVTSASVSSTVARASGVWA